MGDADRPEQATTQARDALPQASGQAIECNRMRVGVRAAQSQIRKPLDPACPLQFLPASRNTFVRSSILGRRRCWCNSQPVDSIHRHTTRLHSRRSRLVDSAIFESFPECFPRTRSLACCFKQVNCSQASRIVSCSRTPRTPSSGEQTIESSAGFARWKF